jgi:hypothetical protein
MSCQGSNELELRIRAIRQGAFCILYTALITGFHIAIGIRRGARSFQLRGGFIEENENFEKSQEL